MRSELVHSMFQRPNERFSYAFKLTHYLGMALAPIQNIIHDRCQPHVWTVNSWIFWEPIHCHRPNSIIGDGMERNMRTWNRVCGAAHDGTWMWTWYTTTAHTFYDRSTICVIVWTTSVFAYERATEYFIVVYRRLHSRCILELGRQPKAHIPSDIDRHILAFYAHLMVPFEWRKTNNAQRQFDVRVMPNADNTIQIDLRSEPAIFVWHPGHNCTLCDDANA